MSQARAVQLSYQDGVRAVELARESVAAFVRRGQREDPGSMRDAFYNRTGAFVRLKSTRGRGRLRGCAGSYSADEQLGHAIVDAAIGAASKDSGGSEVESGELDTLQVSVCVVEDVTLTDDPVADLELGRHGVAVDYRDQHGWLYPTVPVENGWSTEQFLSRTCRKCGLSPLAWQEDEAVVTLIDGQVYRERPDGGSVEEL
ncbi:TIGR00296 family protein [Halobaculum sp. MBLA0147]|uniref:TIGR00296 family protein n=1 Tax=Halobaculum sp. MBLA0147 TaxID=3079934 RepID=UPI0035242DF5